MCVPKIRFQLREKGSQALADLYTIEEERWPPPKMTAETLFELHYGEHIRQSFKVSLTYVGIILHI